MSEKADRRQARPLVHPRRVWTGVALCMLGMALVAVGMTTGAAPVTSAGVVLIGVGLVVAWRGGILRDVHTNGTLRAEVDQTRHGDTRDGITPGSRLPRTPSRDRETQAAEARRDRSTSRSEARTGASLGDAAPTLLLVAAAWTFVSQFALALPYSELGQDTALRDTGIAVVLGLSALYLRQVGPSRLATGLCLACGVALVLAGTVLAHATTRAEWSEIVTGALVLVLAAATASRS
jgi:hypothetical protein